MELMASTYKDVTITPAVFSAAVVELNIPVPGTSPPARLPLTLPFSLHPRSLCLVSVQMFVIKSTTYDDEEMLEGLTKESDMLSRIPLHKNIVTFIGSMLEETLLENDTVSQRCNLFAELAERKAKGRRKRLVGNFRAIKFCKS